MEISIVNNLVANQYSGNVPTEKIVENGELSNLATLTRASIGTFFNSSAFVETAAIDEERINYLQDGSGNSGLLIEEERTNVLISSETLAGTGWGGSGSTYSSDTITLPTGVSGLAYYVTSDERTQSFNGLSVNTIAVSFFSKERPGSGDDFLQIEIFQQTSGTAVSLDSYNFRYTGSNPDKEFFKSITREALPNGWYRFSCDVVRNSGAGTGNFSSSSRLDVDNGNYFWGGQVELTSGGSSSYISTATTTVTRSADLPIISNLDLADWFNPLKGTIYIKFARPRQGEESQPVFLGDGTVNEFLRVLLDSTGNNLSLSSTVGGVDQTPGTSVWVNPGVVNKIAFSFKENDFALAANGGVIATDLSGTLSSDLDNMWIGFAGAFGAHLNGIMIDMFYYNNDLSDISLLNLTNPTGWGSLILDGVSDVFSACSIRRLSSSYNGPCATIRRSSDNATEDFGFVNDLIDTAEITIFLEGSNGFFVRIYDQSGGGNHVEQLTAVNQRSYVESGLNSLPSARSNAINLDQKLTIVNTFSGNSSAFTVAEPFSLSEFQNVIGVDTSPPNAGKFNYRFDYSASDEFGFGARGGGASVIAVLEDPYLLAPTQMGCVNDGDDFDLYVNGSFDQAHSSPGYADASNKIINFGGRESAATLHGDISELIMFDINISSSLALTISADQVSYFGV